MRRLLRRRSQREQLVLFQLLRPVAAAPTACDNVQGLVLRLARHSDRAHPRFEYVYTAGRGHPRRLHSDSAGPEHVMAVLVRAPGT